MAASSVTTTNGAQLTYPMILHTSTSSSPIDTAMAFVRVISAATAAITRAPIGRPPACILDSTSVSDDPYARSYS